LLSEGDRRLLRRLAVFSGGWTLDAATAVTGDAGSALDQLATLDGLTRLVDRSLVQVEHGEATRYRLLETIRQYARDRLLDAGEADLTRAAHFSYFFEMALAAEEPLAGPDMIEWLRRLDAEIDNLRAALDWAMEADPDRGIRMLLALAGYYRVRSFGTEPHVRLSKAAELALARPRVLEGPGRETTIITARIAAAAAQAEAAWGDAATGKRFGEQAVEVARAVGDRRALVEALGSSGMATVFAGSAPEALKASAELLRLATVDDDPWMLSMVLIGETLSATVMGDTDRAKIMLAESTAAAHRSGNPFVIGFAALNRGRIAGFAGDLVSAREAFAEATEMYRAIGDRRFELVARSDLAHAVRRAGDLDEATAIYRETIREWQRQGNRGAIANQLECFAFVALARADPRRAARLFGAAAVIRADVGAPMMPYEAMEYGPAVAELRSSLPTAELERLWKAGAEDSLSEAIEFAVGG
jgi:hypothetical protein